MQRQRLWSGALLCALAFTSCGTSSATDTLDDPLDDTTTTLNAEPGRTVVTTVPVTEGTETTTTTTELTTTTESATTVFSPTSSVDSGQDVLRLAPAAASPSQHVRWSPNSIIDPANAAALSTVSLPDLAEVTAVPFSSPVFQTVDNERVIWELTEAGPVELLGVPEFEALTLEGAGLDADGQAVIFYQHHVFGDPENTLSTLRSLRLADGALTDIANTGGWESGVLFSHLSTRGAEQEQIAVALWGAEGWVWFETIDLVSGQTLFNSESLATSECFAGATNCPDYFHAVAHEGDVIGLRPVPVDEGDERGAFGLWRFDTTSGAEELLVSWPWDNGRWYAEDMFVADNSTIVLSLEDGDGNPLPALFYDLSTGESATEPDAAFLRPAFLN